MTVTRYLAAALAGGLLACALATPVDGLARADGSTAASDVSPTSGSAPGDALVFVLADWSIRALGRQALGVAAWVTGPAGELRVDLLAADPDAPVQRADLMSRAGKGWTLVTGPRTPGVYGAWDREWRTPPTGLADLALAVADRVTGDRTEPGPGPCTLTVMAPADHGEDLPADEAEPRRFRRDLARRARGGGGSGERILVGAADARGNVTVRSSRRPGALVVSPRERRPAEGRAAEVFLPWWPLADVLTWPAAPNPGTSGARPR